MIFAKVDVCLWGHDKFVAAGPAAVGYWIAALTYLREHESSDGYLKPHVLGLLLGLGDREARKLCERLVKVELFARRDESYILLGYASKNETKEEITARRAAVAARVADSRSKRRNGGGNGVHGQACNSSSNALQGVSVPGSDSDSGSEIGERDPEGSTAEPSSHTRLRPAPERYVQPTDPLPDELREAAGMIGVQDVPNAWLKFCGKNAGQWRHVAGAWQSFCATWVQVERRERNAKQDAADAAQAANTERSRRVDERQREHDAEWARREAERAPPPADLLNLVKKVGKR